LSSLILRNQVERALVEGLTSLQDREPDSALTGKLLQYLVELRAWNKAYNLTADADAVEMIRRHLLDSIAILPFMSESDGEGIVSASVLDVGSGAGLPGLPLAIMRPAWSFTLIDSVGKKVRFLRHVVRELGLTNVYPVESRLENYSNPEKFDVIVSRAFSSLDTFVRAVRHLASVNTRIMGMKGKYPESELAELPAWVSVNTVQRIEVPGLHADRHLVMMSLNNDPTLQG
jgi:16S rRNA (guanine527-N7)-methyltransferase